MLDKIEEGIILYDIELNSCRNGVYTDEIVNGTIYNEIIRKREDQGNTEDIVGIYDCEYFDPLNKVISGTLVIKPWNGLKKTYAFEWYRPNEKVARFTGVGFKMNPQQIAVHYKTNKLVI